MKLRLVLATALTLATTMVVAQPGIDFGGTPSATTQLVGPAGASATQQFPRPAINPAGTQFAIAFREGSDIVVQVRDFATETIQNTLTLPAATTGYTDAALSLTYNPAGTELILGWGVGNDAGASIIRIDATTLTAIGSPVEVAALAGAKPKVDFFSDGSLLVAYEGVDATPSVAALIRRYQADLTPVGAPVVVHAGFDIGSQGDTAIGIVRTGNLATDTVIVAWEDDANTRFPIAAPGTEDDVNVRYFDSSLNPLAAFVGVSGANLTTIGGPDERSKLGNPSVVVAPNGKYAVAFEGEGVPSGNEVIWGNFFNADRTVASGADSVRLSSVGLAGRQQAVVLKYHTGTSTFVAAWGARNDTNAYVRFFTEAGVAETTDLVINSDRAVSNVREASWDLVGNKAVAAWHSAGGADANNAFFRTFDITGSATSVSGWEMFH